MKKLLVALLIVCAFSTSTFAQNSTFDKGTSVLSAGIGLGSGYYGLGYSMIVPPVFAAYEYGIVDNLFNNGKGAIGIGGLVGYTSAGWNGAGTTYNVSFITFGAQGALHYEFVDKLDTYGGLKLGYYVVNGSNLWAGNSGALAWGLCAGARYYFTPKVAAMAEIGYGISVLNVGVSFKL